MNIEERSIEESILEHSANIGYLHFADSNRNAPGWGHIDFSSVLKALKQAGVRVDTTIAALPIPNGMDAAWQAFKYISSLCGEV